VIADASGFIQTMNDRFTNPSGRPTASEAALMEAESTESGSLH
jgi:hypothetical protein